MNQQDRKTVLVMGGRGRFGLAAGHAFAAAGWRVLAQMRPQAKPDVHAGIDWLPVAVDDTAVLGQAARGASVVVHALNPPYTEWHTRALPMLEATTQVARQLQALVMLPGNVYNFGSGMPELLTPETPQRADTRKGRIRIAMETRLEALAQENGLRSVVIRAGDFFGSGSGSWFDLALAKDIERGRIMLPHSRDTPTPWAYLPDLAGAFVRTADELCRSRGQWAPFEVFHFSGHVLRGSDWVRLLQDVAWERGWLAPKRALGVRYLPWPLLKFGGLILPAWREISEMRYLWQTPHRLSGDRLAGLIGPEPHTALPAAISAALDGLGKGSLHASGLPHAV